jgi:hypothetical protein
MADKKNTVPVVSPVSKKAKSASQVYHETRVKQIEDLRKKLMEEWDRNNPIGVGRENYKRKVESRINAMSEKQIADLANNPFAKHVGVSDIVRELSNRDTEKRATATAEENKQWSPALKKKHFRAMTEMKLQRASGVRKAAKKGNIYN